MRLLTILTIIMLLFIGTGIYATNKLLQIITNMRNEIPLIETEIEKVNWNQAKIIAKELQIKWNNLQDLWDLFLMHEDIEKIELHLIRIISYISSEDNSSALAELAALDMQLGFIYRNEIFNFQNVF